MTRLVTAVTSLLRQLKTYAQYGVTTVFSLGGEHNSSCFRRYGPARSRRSTARVLFVSGPVSRLLRRPRDEAK